MSEIKIISLGYVNAFLINSSVLVDTGTKGSSRKILSQLDSYYVKPTDIKLIILTHGHDDHIGSLKQLASATGAKVLIHDLEYRQVKHGLMDEIKPVSSFMKLLYRLNKDRTIVNQNKEFEVNIIIDKDFELNPYGVAGKVIFTPGHSKGSISVLLDNGDAIIGDTLMAFLPLSKPTRPFIAYDLGLVKNSMNDLIDKGAKKFFLSHGRSYDLNIIKESLRNL